MSSADQFDFKSLAQQAAREVYDPRAGRCWPWSHQWTMWQPQPGDREQRRRCLQCGLGQSARLSRTCTHQWELLLKGPVTNSNGATVARYWTYRCVHCCEGREVRK